MLVSEGANKRHRHRREARARSSPGDVNLRLLRERRGVLVVLVVLAFLVAQVLLVLLIVVEGTSLDFRTLGLVIDGIIAATAARR